MPTRLIRPISTWRNLSVEERAQLRNIFVVVLPFVVLAVGAIAVLLATFTQPLRVEAPFVFSSPAYAPLHPIDGRVCPGDTLEWPVAFDVRRAPVMVISVRSIWDVDANQTAMLPPGETVPGALQFTNYTETTHVSRTAQMVVPALPPGRYQVRTAVQEFNSQAAAYSVGFSVKEGCPPLEAK